ncbi:lysophospholipase [Nocardiopsis sp. CNT-189]|uniref:alpha/beta fold hydrolase n=1 Tax=Nocardiopsis oceanisediminis TaxID=2816862 RepID=UPI003B2B8E1A
MFTLTATDGLPVHVNDWAPEGAPRAAVQIAHGLSEHSGRYAPLARELAGRGYAVYANDHRGHGRTMHAGPGVLGEDGWNRLVGDMAALSEEIRGRHPGAPLVVLGHSMGSFALQQYLLDHAGAVDGAVLSGTAAVDLLIGHLVEVIGPGGAAEVFNAPFEPARTPADWLSRDEARVDAFLADPLCGFGLDGQAMLDLYAAATERLAGPPALPAAPPLYVLVGEADSLNRGLEFSDELVERYRRAGVADLTYRTYPGARHELFNETNRDEVVSALLTWLDRVTGGGRG